MSENKTHIDSRITPEMLDRIGRLLHQNGLKGLRMDNVAKDLAISKRTLYEIFGSKEDMVIRVMDHTHDKICRRSEEIFRCAPNVMEALMGIFSYHRDNIRDVNVSFFRDMDETFTQMQAKYRKDEEKVYKWTEFIYSLGVKEGMFRPDLDFVLSSRLFKVQMESLKRMEENFPPGLSIVQAFDAITIGFLRSIASPKGMEVLDSLAPKMFGSNI